MDMPPRFRALGCRIKGLNPKALNLEGLEV